MKLFLSIISNVCVALNVSVLVVLYLDMRNPMMGFLSGRQFYSLGIICCILSIVSSIFLYSGIRGRKSKKIDTKTDIDT